MAIEESPVYAFVLHDSRCGNNCVFCAGTRDFGDIEKNVESELKKFNAALDRGERIERIEISGNDPGEYPRLPELVEKLRRKTGAKTVILLTHGRALANNHFLMRLIASGVDYFIIPLYGHTSAIHEAVTTAPLSFSETLAGIRNLKRLGHNAIISTMITRENQKFLKDFFSFACDLTKDFLVGIPCYVKGLPRFKRSIPDFARLGRDLSDALRFASERGFFPVLLSIPRCLLDFPYSHFNPLRTNRLAYEHWRNDELLKSGEVREKDGEIIPRYRAMAKGEECGDCIYDDKCTGFFENYIEAGYFKFSPIRESLSSL